MYINRLLQNNNLIRQFSTCSTVKPNIVSPPKIEILKSKIDPSVNFIQQYGKGKIESRYVRKGPHYISAYVSSHSGCTMKCRMCFLTQNKDFTMDHVDIKTYASQINTILSYYKADVEDQSAVRCNINFMAKGEALANKNVVNRYPELYDAMNKVCNSYGLITKPNISTIMPYTVRDKKLIDIFQQKPAYLYYSLYSLDPEFRKKWLPNAIPYQQALDKLKEYQMQGGEAGNVITFHWSLIKGCNDSLEQAEKIADCLKKYNFNAKLNIVRFNPHPNLSEEEPSKERIDEIFNIISPVFKNDKSYVVKRVDPLVFAACGMFATV